MNIPVKELKKFQNLSSHVVGSNILPAHKYLKVGEGKICKNVSSSFILFDCKDAEGDPILVSEEDLFSLLSVTTSSVISINIKKNKVEISDGRDKILMQIVDKRTYNEPPGYSGDTIELSENFWEVVSKASHFAHFIKDASTYYGYIHINENCVCAGDGIIAFHSPIDEDIKLVIEGKTAASLSKFKITSIAQTENNHFFFSEEATYGFIKSVIGWLDIKRMFLHERKMQFTLSASDLISFNNLSLKLTKDPMVTISTGKFEMNDMLVDKRHERDVEGVKMPGEFSYNPERMNTVLKGLDVEEIDFSENEPAYYLSSKETKATALIAKIQKPK